ncbi:MAG TPA: phosphatase PAP2 family protein [Mycobacteriales bacterium]|jgi:hypothetical protein|nr:phosphatase PAP2 family protein [Mycobacteriales bacterium]
MVVQTQERNLAPPEAAARVPTRRLRWWHEVLLIAVGYAIYTVIRDQVPIEESSAFGHARDLEGLERRLGLFHEHGLNTWLAAHHSLVIVANYWYALAHFAVTGAIAVWVLWKHPQHARPLRLAWYSMNVAALVGFALYPLAPPRLMPGFIDTVVQFDTWGSWGSHGVDAASNQFAAMPSMHMGWSTWCAVVVVVLARRWWVKLLAVSYPVITLLVIVGTANHYFLDVAGGLGALAIGFGVQRLITRRAPFEPVTASATPRAVAAAPVR